MAEVDEPQNQVLCPQCGTPIPQGGTFCPECGLNMADVAGGQPAPRFCGHCGRPLVPGAAFCAECGQPLSRATAAPQSANAPAAPAAVQPAPSAAPDPASQHAPYQAAQALQPSPNQTAAPTAAQRRAVRPKAALVAAVSVIAAVAVIGGVLLFGPLRTKPAKRIPVMVTLQVPGLNERSSRIPVFVEGTTAEGKPFQENAFIDQSGSGLELPVGDYTLAVEASPIAEDGTIYQVPEEPIEVVVRNASMDMPEAGAADKDAGDAAADSKPQSDTNANGVAGDSGEKEADSQDEEEPALTSQGNDSEAPDDSESGADTNESQGTSEMDELVVTIVLVLEPIEPTEVTEDQIAAAMAYVQKDDMRAAFAVRLQTAADDKVETAKKEKEEKRKAEEEAKRKAEEEAKRKAEEEQRQREEEERRQREEEEAARRYAATHYDGRYFSVEVPESWEGNWSVDYETYTGEYGIEVEQWTFRQDADGSGGATVRTYYGNGGKPAGWEICGTTVQEGMWEHYDHYVHIIMQQAAAGFFFDGGATISVYDVYY